MQKVTSVRALQEIVSAVKANGESIGFVPTMGALHNGHLSLVGKAKRESDFVVASLFVNPNQFNNSKDLENYPRDSKRDIALLESVGCDLLFEPPVYEVYPEEDTREFNFGTLTQVMEGEFRPGHFNGVAQVVSRLFDIVMPNRAFFGQKDFQQLAIIKQLVKICNYDITIVPCETIRESDGLAMSSRNQLLTEQHRTVAPVIYRALTRAKEIAKEIDIAELKSSVVDEIESTPLLEVEYFDIVDGLTLESLSSLSQSSNPVGAIAVFAGEVRLIDNIIF